MNPFAVVLGWCLAVLGYALVLKILASRVRPRLRIATPRNEVEGPPLLDEVPPSELSVLQAAVGLWVAGTFHRLLCPAHDALAVVEEAGEVARAILKRDQAKEGVDRMGLGVDHWTGEVRTESADVLIALLSLAENEGFDLLTVTRDRFREVRTR